MSPNEHMTVDTLGLPTVFHTAKFDQHYAKSDLMHHRKRTVFLPGIDTKYMAWIDDDDELPWNVVDVCAELVDLMGQDGTNIGYTNELVRHQGRETISRGMPYSRREYELRDYRMMHHLVVMEVQAAREVALLLPEGIYWAEYLFNIYLAELGLGATYLDKTGYIWNRVENDGRMHDSPLTYLSTKNSKDWARSHLPRRT